MKLFLASILLTCSAFAQTSEPIKTNIADIGLVSCQTPYFSCLIDGTKNPGDVEGGKDCWCSSQNGPIGGSILDHTLVSLKPNYLVCNTKTTSCKVIPSKNDSENSKGASCWCATTQGPDAGKIVKHVQTGS